MNLLHFRSTGMEEFLSQEFDYVLDDGDRPIWLCDVDGILNARAPEWPGATESAPIDLPSGRELLLTWSSTLIDGIDRLIRSSRVDFVWSTTWCDLAWLLEEFWGLPSFTPDDEPRIAPAWKIHLNGPAAMVMKQTALQAAIESGRPVIHTDDHVALNYAGPDFLAIRPDTHYGLGPGDFDRIEAFIDSHQR